MTYADYGLSLEYVNPEVYLGNEEPDDFLYQYGGIIVGHDDDDHRILFGKFNIFYVDISNGLDAGLEPLEVLDGHASTNEFSPLFSRACPDFSETVQKLCNYDLLSLNILIIDRLEVLPRYRGHGISTQVVKGLIQRFGHGAGLVTLKVFPLQLEVGYPTDSNVEAWRKRMGLAALDQNTTKAKASLKSFYKRLGFKQVPKTDLMIANLAEKLP